MIDRPEPPEHADERTTLIAFVDYFRATLLMKAEGLTDEQARTASVAPSDLSIAGLLRHMAEVERHWFQVYVRGDVPDPLFPIADDRDADLHVPATVTLAECIEVYEREIALSRAITDEHSLDDLSITIDELDGWHPNLRWILVHMVEEYARHCGHADLIRERIDGVTGD